MPGFTRNIDGTIIPDPVIVSILKSYREDINYHNSGGVKVLMHLLRRNYGFHINHKKIYRLAKENSLLLPRNRKKLNLNRKISKNRKIRKPNQLWQFDIKTGYVHGTNTYFYLLAVIDVFNRKVMGWHLGSSCKAKDLKFTINQAVKDHRPKLDGLVIRSDNGPQMTSKQFYDYVKNIGLEHEFIPVKTPNKNAFIESFFSIYEAQFIQVRYFDTLKDAYDQTDEFINFYNNQRLHGSLGYKTPEEFDQICKINPTISKLVRC